MHSICEHGPTTCLIEKLKPLLVYHEVAAYLNGHDHCAQFIDVGDGVQYHTIGSAHKNSPSTEHKKTVTDEQLKWHTGKGDGGFASVSITDEGMTVIHRDGPGNILYTSPTVRPKFTIPILL